MFTQCSYSSSHVKCLSTEASESAKRKNSDFFPCERSGKAFKLPQMLLFVRKLQVFFVFSFSAVFVFVWQIACVTVISLKSPFLLCTCWVIVDGGKNLNLGTKAFFFPFPNFFKSSLQHSGTSQYIKAVRGFSQAFLTHFVSILQFYFLLTPSLHQSLHSKRLHHFHVAQVLPMKKSKFPSFVFY